MKYALVVFLSLSLFVFPRNPQVLATDFSSTNFQVKDPVLVPGAGFSVAVDFQLITSIGQGVIGESTSGSFRLKQGFLYFPGPSAGGGGGTPGGGGGGIVVAGGGGGPSATSTTSSTRPVRPPPKTGKSCDFNNSGACDIFDFSILLAFYGETTTPLTDRYDLNSDGEIGFYDLSILFYYWVS